MAAFDPLQTLLVVETAGCRKSPEYCRRPLIAVAGHRSIGFMPDFRLLFLDASGAAAHVYEFCAPDVDAALSVAEGKRGLSIMELWTGERKVQRWDCFPPE